MQLLHSLDVGPSQIEHEISQSSQVSDPVSYLPSGQDSQTSTFKIGNGLAQERHVVADPSQVKQFSSQGSHVPSLSNSPSGHAPTHAPRVLSHEPQSMAGSVVSQNAGKGQVNTISPKNRSKKKIS